MIVGNTPAAFLVMPVGDRPLLAGEQVNVRTDIHLGPPAAELTARLDEWGVLVSSVSGALV
jgi:hypothetical protein